MSDTVPSWTQVSEISNEVVDVGETVQDHAAESTIDLSAKFGMWLQIQVAREDNTAIDVPVRINVRREPSGVNFPNSPLSRVGGTVTAADTTVDGNSAAGQGILNVTDTTGFAAGDFIGIGSMSDGVRLEFARIAKVTNPGAGGELVLDSFLEIAHTAAQADIVTNQADLWHMWLDGGESYHIFADYGEAASGPDLVVNVQGQTYDKLVTTG